MASRIEINVEKMFDRGPKYGLLEVQVTFEQKASPDGTASLAYVVVSLPKAEVGKISFDQIRAMALTKAYEFMNECLKNSEPH